MNIKYWFLCMFTAGFWFNNLYRMKEVWKKVILKMEKLKNKYFSLINGAPPCFFAPYGELKTWDIREIFLIPANDFIPPGANPHPTHPPRLPSPLLYLSWRLKRSYYLHIKAKTVLLNGLLFKTQRGRPLCRSSWISFSAPTPPPFLPSSPESSSSPSLFFLFLFFLAEWLRQIKIHSTWLIPLLIQKRKRSPHGVEFHISTSSLGYINIISILDSHTEKDSIAEDWLCPVKCTN